VCSCGCSVTGVFCTIFVLLKCSAYDDCCRKVSCGICFVPVCRRNHSCVVVTCCLCCLAIDQSTVVVAVRILTANAIKDCRPVVEGAGVVAGCSVVVPGACWWSSACLLLRMVACCCDCDHRDAVCPVVMPVIGYCLSSVAIRAVSAHCKTLANCNG
jgi:hypothetical protein